MRPSCVLAIYFAAIFLGGALLAPGLYHGVQGLAQEIPALKGLAQEPFHRYVNRCFLVVGAAALVPALRWLKLGGWAGVGITGFSAQLRPWLQGFGWGFGSLALVVLLVLGAGAREWDDGRTGAAILRHLLNATLAALVVSVMEELFFRGAVFGSLRREWGTGTALVASSAVYAWLHFFQRPPPPPEVAWWTGLALLPHMMRGFGDVTQLVPGFFNLWLAGCMLALAYQRRGHLAFSIGLHAGWIFWLKSYGFFTREVAGTARWWWGTGRLIDGWVALGILGIVLACLWRWLPSSGARSGACEFPEGSPSGEHPRNGA